MTKAKGKQCCIRMPLDLVEWIEAQMSSPTSQRTFSNTVVAHLAAVKAAEVKA